MKIFLLMLALTAAVGTMCAQNAASAFVVRPYVSIGNLAGSRFWTPSTIALIALDGAAKTADSYFTRMNIAGGGEEYNPLARPFVHTAGVQAASMAATFGAELAAAYFLHRRRHDNLERGVLAAGTVTNGLGAAASFKHRVPDW
jgi:hypothetical protein